MLKAVLKKAVLPPTAFRVPFHTRDEVNERIRSRTVQDIAKYVGRDRQELTGRIHALSREWDTERTLETTAGVLTLAGSLLGAAVRPRWFALSGIVGGFLLMHALQGWCPPLPVIRRLGFRTPEEIDEEKMVLKALRGDFAPISPKE